MGDVGVLLMPSPTQQIDLLIEGGIVITVDSERRIFNPGYVAIEDGRIVDVGEGGASGFSPKEHLDAFDMVVLPGLVNSHNHLDQSVHRGCHDEDPDSRTKMLDLSRALTRERAFIAASASLLEQVEFGITTTHESHWTHYHKDSTLGVCDAIRRSGMRAVIARSMSDEGHFPDAITHPDFRERIDDVLADLDSLAAEYDSERMQIISEPSTMQRCTPEAIVAMRDWALRNDKIWHIHLAQHEAELQHALKTIGMGSVQYAEQLGVLGPEMQAAHCGGILDEEVALLGEYRVRVAHCPLTIIRSGGTVPPIWELENAGATVAVGTDGSGTNNGQNLWESMKMAIYLQRVRFGQRDLGSAEQALELATIKAARALGLEQRVGSLETGKAADIALFRLDQLSIAPEAALINNLVYSSVSNRADTVLVGGEILLKNGESTVFDKAEVVGRLREAQASMIRETDLTKSIQLASTWPVSTAAG